MRRSILSILLCHVCLGMGAGQSMEQRAEQYLQLGQQNKFRDADSALLYFREAYKLAVSADWPEGRIRALDRLANLALLHDKILLADSLYAVILSDFTFDQWPDLIFTANMHSGMMHVTRGNLDKALSIFQKMILLREQNDPGFTLIPERGIALVHEQKGNNEIAEVYYQKAYDLAKEIGKVPLSIAVYSMSRFYLKTDNIAKFGQYNQEYLDLMDVDRVNENTFHTHLASLYSDADGNVSKEHLLHLVDRLQHTGQRRSFSVACQLLGRMQVKERDWKGAVTIFELALDPTLSSELPYLRLYPLEQLYMLYDSLGDDRMSKKYLLEYHHLVNAINNAESRARIDALEVQFQTEQKEKEILRQQAALEKSRNERMWLLGIGLFMLVIALALWQKLATNRKLAIRDKVIREQRIASLEKESKILAMDSMISGQEAERGRIARDLHDGLGSLMATIRSHFLSIQDRTTMDSQQALFNRTNELIGQACDEVRRIAYDMMPEALGRSGLADAIADLIAQLEDSTDMSVSLEIVGLNQRLSKEREVMIYRILQELVMNIVRHANARHLLVQLIRRNGLLHVLVEDDGIGFDVERAQQNGGLGLKNLRSRVEFLKGHFEVDSVLDQGTTTTINIPV